MGSVLKRLAKGAALTEAEAAKVKARWQMVEKLMFGGLSSQAEHRPVRLRLMVEMLNRAEELKELDPRRFWNYLSDCRVRYDRAKHGPSALMRLLERVETQLAKEKQDNAQTD